MGSVRAAAREPGIRRTSSVRSSERVDGGMNEEQQRNLVAAVRQLQSDMRFTATVVLVLALCVVATAVFTILSLKWRYA